MKTKNIYRLFALAATSLSLVSCEDTLDVNREDVLSDQAIWASVDAADAYVTASYKIFTDDAQLKNCRSKFWDSYSDLSKSSSWDQYGHPYNSFLMNGLTDGVNGAGAFECWGAEYSRIRTANACLTGLHRYGTKHGEDFVKTREAEIRLCRAYSYFRLARVYGGVILRTETSGANGMPDGAISSDIPQARATEAETYRYIMDELRFAAKNLPKVNNNQWLRGRATRYVAYGLMSRVGLYAGLWKEAIEAADSVKKYSGKTLDPDFAALFVPGAENSSEVLFALEYLKGNISLTHLWDSSVSPGGDAALNNNTGAYAEHQPTAELADLYEWKDGTPFKWSTWIAEGHADPYTDREPRFHATILYNGADWRGRKIEPYTGGTDGFYEFRRSGSSGGKSVTGYFFRKYLDESNHEFVESKNKSWTPQIILRLGEVLLNQAEAYTQDDFMANQTKILDDINAIRTRVQLPALTVADIPTAEACMNIIRNERAKELVCEGLRIWDLRRWGLAESVIGGKAMHGVKISKVGSNFSYERVEVDGGTTRVWPARYKYFSIPLSERSNNSMCDNNPGW